MDDRTENRSGAARAWCRMGAFMFGALGCVMLVQPASINDILPVIDLPRWWGLAGVLAGAGLFYVAQQLGELELPENLQQRRDDARVEGDWMEVYRLTRREAEFLRQEGEEEGERQAREDLVDLALDRLGHGDYQALRHLERLREIAPGETEYLERRIEVLRRVGSVDGLAEAIEERLAGDVESEAEAETLREELVGLVEELDRPDLRTEHGEWVLARIEDRGVAERYAGWVDEGIERRRVVEMFAAAAEGTANSAWAETLATWADELEDEAGAGAGKEDDDD